MTGRSFCPALLFLSLKKMKIVSANLQFDDFFFRWTSSLRIDYKLGGKVICVSPQFFFSLPCAQVGCRIHIYLYIITSVGASFLIIKFSLFFFLNSLSLRRSRNGHEYGFCEGNAIRNGGYVCEDLAKSVRSRCRGGRTDTFISI